MILPSLVHRATLLVGVLAGLGFGACRATDEAPQRPASVAAVRPEPLEPSEAAQWIVIGDEISIHDPRATELQISRLHVGIDGTVMLPRLGAFVVAGLTEAQIERALTERYAPYYGHLDIEVRITELGPRYIVLGEVEKPGARDYPGDLTLFEAVQRAQPKSYSANLGRVRLIRADPRDPFTRYFDIRSMLESGDSSENAHVLEGDVIEVPTIQEPGSSTPR